MRKIKFFTLATFPALLITNMIFGQAPNLGSAADYVLYTSSGAVGNTGTTHITGNVGTNVGAISSFGNIDGDMNSANAATLLCSTDLLIAYNELMGTTNTAAHGPVLGGGETLSPGIYSLAAAGSIAGSLTLDASGDSSAVFIFKIGGAFTSEASSEVILLNGTQACNVFWVAEGAIALAASTTMSGTLIAHDAAISMASAGKLEGRLFSTTGAVAIEESIARLPFGCGATILTGPAAPDLGVTECFALFTGNGPLSNTGLTYVTGDVGTNMGTTSGFTDLNVLGTIHTSPDAYTALCASDLNNVVTSMTAISSDIELLFPAQLGNNLQLTPHAYFMNGAATLTDTLFLNAQNNASAVFYLFIDGALTATPNSKILLMNGAQSKNVYWLVNGGVNLNDSSLMIGTIVSTNGAVDIYAGAYLDGRVLTTDGSFTTNVITAVHPTNCGPVGIESKEDKGLINIYPNPFKSTINIQFNNIYLAENTQISIYNVLGELMLQERLIKSFSVLNTGVLSPGMYFYAITDNQNLIQTGQLMTE